MMAACKYVKRKFEIGDISIYHVVFSIILCLPLVFFFLNELFKLENIKNTQRLYLELNEIGFRTV